jgi:hypothetical protein
MDVQNRAGGKGDTLDKLDGIVTGACGEADNPETDQ